MTYVMGMLAPVPVGNKEAYRRHAAQAKTVFQRHGALDVQECWGDFVPDGKLNSLKTAVLLHEGETVVMSWIVWPDKATCEAGMSALMQAPEMSQETNPMPFDGSRMIYGGFEAMVLD